MSKRELMLKVFNNQKAERVPVGFWFHLLKDPEMDGLVDPSLIEINLEGTKKFFNEFKPDFVKIMSDGFFTCPNRIFLDSENNADLWKVKPLGENHEWVEKQVEFVKKLAAFFGSDTMTFYNIFAPATNFKFGRKKQGRNTDKIFADFALQDADAMAYALDVVADDNIALIKRLITEVKVDGIYYSTGDIADSRVTPEIRKKVVMPSDLKILNAAKELSTYNILHICGWQGRRNNLANFADYPASIINWASVVEKVSLGEGKKLFKGKPVIGGFDNTSNGILYKGGKAEIEAETERLLEEAGTLGVVLGADCTVPGDIDLRHLQWVRDKAASFH
jgi:uroporphyrinogen decarboxylase